VFANRTKYACADGSNSTTGNGIVAGNGGCGPQVREIDVPAEYRTITKHLVDGQPQTREVVIPGEFKTVSKQIVASAAGTTEKEIPAEYRTITKTVVKTPATVTEKEIPAEFATYTTTSMSSSGTYADWVEILCGNKITSATVRAIQKALRAKVYDPGPDDNVLGPRTNAAIIKFQKDSNLPQGNLNLETLKALNVEY